jgi:MSHA biogenesis protein MshO
MRRHLPSDATAASRRPRGFTLVEAVIVIAITGILAAIVTRFIVQPVQLYLATQARAQLVDVADNALRRIARELRVALPNSPRVSSSGLSLELIPTTGAARYKTEGTDRLQFGTVDTSFDIVGPALTLGSAQQLVFYNLGPGITGSDAYAANSSATEQSNSNRRTATNAAGSTTAITVSSLSGLPVGDFSAPYRVFAVDPPVTYRCDLGAGTLTRYSAYGFQATQPDPPSGATANVLATGVTACAFTYDASVFAMRAGLVSLQLSLATSTPSGTESITLHHEVHVDNLP